jgi:para-nitrobenzyl esterase
MMAAGEMDIDRRVEADPRLAPKRDLLGVLLGMRARKAAAGGAPVYMYLFTYVSNFLGGLLKAGHGTEIPFVFDNTDDVPLAGDKPEKYQLAAAMSEAWIAYARTGNPSHPGIPKWEPYTLNKRNTMLFNVQSRLEIDPAREELDAWEDMEIRR